MYLTENDNHECPDCKSDDVDTLKTWRNNIQEHFVMGLHRCQDCLRAFITYRVDGAKLKD